MKINTSILDVDNKIKSEQWEKIKSIVNDHAQIAGQKLSLKSINITLYPNKDWCIKETGDGGYTASSDWIQLFIDPMKQNSLQKILDSSFPASIYHEMHHARRMKKVGFGESLLEVIISEGLATIFAEEMFDKFQAPWAKYTKNEIDELLEIFDHNKNRSKFNYQEWFLGYGRPHWLGYKIGSYVIRELKRKNVKLTCDKMVDIKAGDIFKLWNENL